MTKAKTQAERVSPRSGTAPPKERQFGQPNGNKQGRGFWRREDSPRYKLEQMMKLNEEEIRAVAEDRSAPLFERKIAIAIARSDWKTLEAMTNQVYGYPAQEIHQTNMELNPILPKPVAIAAEVVKPKKLTAKTKTKPKAKTKTKAKKTK